MSTRQIITDMLRDMDSVSSAQAQAATGVGASSVKIAFLRLKAEGEVVRVGSGPGAVWCRPANAQRVLSEINRRTEQLRESKRQRIILKKRADRARRNLAWGDAIPVHRIVPALQAKAPAVGVRWVWDLAA